VTASPMSDYPPAVARIVCGSERHAIRWEEGELIALDHGDPEGERGLAALGGTSYACIEALGAWARCREDPRLLSALTRGPSDPLALEPGSQGHRGPQMTFGASSPRRRAVGGSGGARGWVGLAPMSSGVATFTASGSMQPPERTRSFEGDIVLLAGLGQSMEMRLVATVTARLLQRIEADEPETGTARPALESSLFGRVSSTVRTWLGASGTDVAVDVVEPGDEVISGGEDDNAIRVALPLEWVSEVWGRDLAIVGGRFALALVEATENRTTLQTVGSDLGSPRPLTVELS
jgi:hypothetical protein